MPKKSDKLEKTKKIETAEKKVKKIKFENTEKSENVIKQKIDSKYLLNLVSRSFALCIPLLDKNKQKKVENQYLLARILDTIEDSTLEIKDKESLMQSFILILKTGDTKQFEDIKNILIEKTINENDKVLIENSKIVLDTFFKFEDEVKNISVNYLKEMAYGMIYYQDHKISTFEDLDDYCYYVAGTVGMYLTELLSFVDEYELDKELGKSFARLLQKVNIIKDARGDLYEHRFFLPIELFENENPLPYFNNENYKDKALDILNKVIENIIPEAEKTILYINAIEKKSIGYKGFCLLASIMAFETIKIMKGNYDVFISNTPIKIERKKTMDILLKIKSGYYTSAKLADILKSIKE